MRADGSHSAAGEGDKPADDSASSEVWLERSVVGLLRLLTDSLWTGWAIFTRPHRLPIAWMNGSVRPAPPFSFLIVSLLAVGFAIRLALLYYGRPVDQSLLSRLGETLGSLAIKDIFLLTVPCVVLVKMTGAGVARWTRPQKRFEQNPIVAWVTYAAGFQCLAIAGLCAGSLSFKILSHKETVLPSQYEDEAVVLAGSMILLLSATLVYAAIRGAGTTAIARSRLATWFLSVVTVCTTLIGVLIVNSISFNVESTIGEVLRDQQRANLGDHRVVIRTLDSRILEEVMGQPVVEVTVAMMNISDETVAVPRPRVLESADESTSPAIEVLHDSLDWTGQAGWILAPGETKLTTWTLRLPEWCAEATQQWNGVSVVLCCSPLNRDVDLAETNPIGDPQLILTTLRLPPLGGSPSTGERPEERIAAEPQSRQ